MGRSLAIAPVTNSLALGLRPWGPIVLCRIAPAWTLPSPLPVQNKMLVVVPSPQGSLPLCHGAQRANWPILQRNPVPVPIPRTICAIRSDFDPEHVFFRDIFVF